MDSNRQNKLYENTSFQKYTEDILRPGGLELTAEIVETAGFDPGSSLLDIGCGCGRTVEFLSEEYRISGIDISQELIAKGKSRNPALNLSLGDAQYLTAPDQSLDGVLAECVMSLLENPPAVFSQIKRVLKREGKLAASDLYIREGNGHFTGIPLVTCLNGMRTEREIIKEMQENGFSLLAWEDKTTVFKGFLAGMIMNYGSMTAFWKSLVGDCNKVCRVQESLKGIKIGYYLAVWQKA